MSFSAGNSTITLRLRVSLGECLFRLLSFSLGSLTTLITVFLKEVTHNSFTLKPSISVNFAVTYPDLVSIYQTFFVNKTRIIFFLTL